MGAINKIKEFCFVGLRVQKYRWLSDCKHVFGKPHLYHPLLLKGMGKIYFGSNVQVGVIASPHYYSHYAFIEARFENSEIHIGNNVAINNNFSIVAFSKVQISDNVLIGVNCSIMDNDGHNLSHAERDSRQHVSAVVFIGENVFLGDNVTILKGVTIGRNSVIGNGSIVTRNIPANVIAAGSPAREIRKL